MKGDNTLVIYVGDMSNFDVGEEHKDYIIKSVARLSNNSEPMLTSMSKMLMTKSTSNLQPNMQISLKMINGMILVSIA
ncbi:hypothetical protein Lal_00017291 [Lupinus albus]|nr:hypothetical protein Lal_00017291 [Lupinus albus]